MKLFVIPLLVLATVFADGAAPARPALTLVDRDPLTVRGVAFRPNERVKLLVTPGPVTRRARAGVRGGFRVSLGFTPGRCDDVVVQAIGEHGSRAMVDVIRPDCTTP